METELDYEITITRHNDYVHVYAEGLGSYEGAQDLWQQVVRACEETQCYNILGEQYLFCNLTTPEALKYPDLFKAVGVTKKHRIAWVDKNPRTREMTEFIHNLLTNRLLGNGRIFNSTDAAKHWLIGSTIKKQHT